MTTAGERLNGLTGVACILRFPLPEIDDLDEGDFTSDSDADEEEEKEQAKKDDDTKSVSTNPELSAFEREQMEMVLDGLEEYGDVDGYDEDVGDSDDDSASVK